MATKWYRTQCILPDFTSYHKVSSWKKFPELLPLCWGRGRNSCSAAVFSASAGGQCVFIPCNTPSTLPALTWFPTLPTHCLFIYFLTQKNTVLPALLIHVGGTAARCQTEVTINKFWITSTQLNPRLPQGNRGDGILNATLGSSGEWGRGWGEASQLTHHTNIKNEIRIDILWSLS